MYVDWIGEKFLLYCKLTEYSINRRTLIVGIGRAELSSESWNGYCKSYFDNESFFLEWTSIALGIWRLYKLETQGCSEVLMELEIFLDMLLCRLKSGVESFIFCHEIGFKTAVTESLRQSTSYRQHGNVAPS